jgi:hypothetical protein
VYAVHLHPTEPQLVSGGYDKTVRLYDVAKGVLLRTLHGHQLAVSAVLFNAAGNLVVSPLVNGPPPLPLRAGRPMRPPGACRGSGRSHTPRSAASALGS